MSKVYFKNLKKKMRECYNSPYEMCDAVSMISIHYKQWQHNCEQYDNNNVIKKEKNSFLKDLVTFYDNKLKKSD